MLQKEYKTIFYIFFFSVFLYGQNTLRRSPNQDIAIKAPVLLNKQCSTTSIFTLDKTWSDNSAYKPHWFYQLGPYNDLWGSDILQAPRLSLQNRTLFPSNRVFNISTANNNVTRNNNFMYLTIFGFQVKKLGKIDSNKLFYGSERRDY